MNRILFYPLLGWGATLCAHAGLLAYYPFDDDFNDASGNGRHLTVGAGNPAISTAAGEHVRGGGALDLDQASNAYLALAPKIRFGTADAWTVSFWARRRPGAGIATGMVTGDNTTTDSFIWLPDNSNQVRGLRFRPVGVGTSNNYDYPTGHDTDFHHWVVVADGTGSIRVYRDNVDLGTRTPAGGTDFDINAVGSGYTGTTQIFDGQIDELRIYDEALDAAAVAALYGLPPDGDPPTPVTAKRLRVFLIGGQSNADGRADAAGLPTSPVDLQQPQEDVDFYKDSLTTLRPFSQFGPEITMGRRLADSIADGAATRIAIIKHAAGGTSLAVDWKAGGDATTAGDGSRYVTFQQTVSQGLAALAAAYPEAVIEIEGMLWLQGERDAKGGLEDGYESNLTAFIADVRATYGADLLFVIGRLSIDQTDIPPGPLGVVRAAQAAVADADPRAALLDTDVFGMKGDDLHFDAAGQQQIGNGGAGWLLDFYPFQSPPTIEARPGGEFGITVSDAFDGFVHTLESSGTMKPGDWETGESKTAADGTVEFSVTPGPSVDRRFYRVRRTLVP